MHCHRNPGHNPDFGTAQYTENVAGHALVGCASSAASGGSCESGALSGAVGSAFAPAISGANGLFPNAQSDIAQRIGGTIFAATIGGFASVLGGGKFANGAITAAFGYQYNQIAPTNGLSAFGLPITTTAAEGEGYSVQQDVNGQYQNISQQYGPAANAGPVVGAQGMLGVLGASIDVSPAVDTTGKACVVVNGCVIIGLGAGGQLYEGGQAGTGRLSNGVVGTVGIVGGFAAGTVGSKVSPFTLGFDGNISGSVAASQGAFIGGGLKLCGQGTKGCSQ